MSRLIKNQNFLDDNSSLTKKVQILEKQLAEKTNLLERTAKNLADSEKQYQILLLEFENLKSKVFSNNQINMSNSFSKNINFSVNTDVSSFSSFDEINNNRCNFNQSLKQLKNVEGNVQNLSLQNSSLQSKIDRLMHDQQKWHNFAYSIFSSIQDIAEYKNDFPKEDSEAQRFILLDLIQKLARKCTSNLANENLLKKYRISKIKLKQVQMKCDKMLQLLGEKGYDVSSFEQDIPNYHSIKKSVKKQKRVFNALSESNGNENNNYDLDFDDFQIKKKGHLFDSDDFNNCKDIKHEFKNDVKRLSSVAHNMKGYYRNYAQLVNRSKLQV